MNWILYSPSLAREDDWWIAIDKGRKLRDFVIFFPLLNEGYVFEGLVSLIPRRTRKAHIWCWLRNLIFMIAGAVVFGWAAMTSSHDFRLNSCQPQSSSCPFSRLLPHESALIPLHSRFSIPRLGFLIPGLSATFTVCPVFSISSSPSARSRYIDSFLFDRASSSSRASGENLELSFM